MEILILVPLHNKSAKIKTSNSVTTNRKSNKFCVRTHVRVIFKFPNKNGAISTSRLNTLLYVHLKPINLIVS